MSNVSREGITLGITFGCIVFTSCLPQKSLTYFQPADSSQKNIAIDTAYHPVIRKNDILNIHVSSISNEASSFFNYNENNAPSGRTSPNDYIVDEQGNIQIPFAGNIKVEGMTSLQAKDSVKVKLEKYLINPNVKLVISNFRVTVLGEVNKPGVYTVSNEKITLTEALAMAGDLTVYGKRNVMVIRESNGKKEFVKVDLTSRDLFSLPYYNLHSNDIVFVEAIPQKKFSAQTYYRVLPLFLSGLSLAAVLLSLINNN